MGYDLVRLVGGGEGEEALRPGGGEVEPERSSECFLGRR